MIFKIFNNCECTSGVFLQPGLKESLDEIRNTERSFYHFSFLNDIKLHGIYLNSINRYLSLYPFIRKPHYHDFYSLVFIEEGQGTFNICTNTYDITPNTLFLVAPNQIHSFEGFKCTDGIVFFFCQDFYVEEFSYIRLLNVFSGTAPDKEKDCGPAFASRESEKNNFRDLVRSIHHEYKVSDPSGSSAMIIRSLLNILILRLSDIINTSGGRTVTNDNTLIHSLSHLIESYYMQEHNIGFYTGSFNCSEKYLNDLCNRHFQCGLKKILLDRLMQESRRLLLSSEMTVSQIAYKLNFQDASYFNKVFSRNTGGLSPKRFREMHRRHLP